MQIAERMKSIPFTPIRKIFEEAARREEAGETIIHLELGRPDFDTPDHIKAAAIKALEEGKVHYSSNYGIPELCAAIADKFKRDNNLDYDPATEIIVTVGATEAIFMTMMALLDPGDEALIPMPAFPAYTRCVYMAGAVPVPVPAKEANDFTPSVQDLRSQITSRTRLLVVNTPNNPTGAVYSAEVLEQMAALAVENDLIVLADEIYEKNIYDGHRHYSMAVYPGMKERTITVNGFSKAYSMTGWRLGYLASSPELIAALIRIKSVRPLLPSGERSKRSTVPRMSLRKWWLNLIGAGKWSWSGWRRCPESLLPDHGGFYIFINTRQVGKPPQQIAAELLEKAKIALVPWGDEHIRISYANSYKNLSKAMDALEQVLSEWCR
jgi:aspartate/methionine/tyrosine aminotransferase